MVFIRLKDPSNDHLLIISVCCIVSKELAAIHKMTLDYLLLSRIESSIRKVWDSLLPLPS